VFAQNLETVRRLTHPVRDARAGYEQTLAVLAHAKQHRPEVFTKSSLMLGLGESDEEVLEAMDDLRAVSVNVFPARWCVRAIAQNRHWPATTSG
jgi:lipoyl synthase